MKTNSVFADRLILIEGALQSPIRVEHIKFFLELSHLLYVLHLFSQDEFALFLSLCLCTLVEALSISNGLCSHRFESVKELLFIKALSVFIHILSQTTLLNVFSPLLIGLLHDVISIHSDQAILIVVRFLLLHHLVLQVLLQLLILSLFLDLLCLGLKFVVASILVNDGTPELIMCFVSYGAKESSNLWRRSQTRLEPIRHGCFASLAT